MEIYQMRYFCALVAHNHFSRAAEDLHITPPTLTIAIKKLENELGAVLIDRSAASFTLTAAGKFFYINCVSILENIDDLEKSLHDMSGSQNSFMLFLDHSLNCKAFNDLLELFMQENPDTDLWIKWMDYSEDRAVLSEKPNILAIIPRIEGQKLSTYPFRSYEFCALIPPSHPLAQQSALSTDQLKEHASDILNSDLEALPLQLRCAELESARHRLSVNSNELLKAAVELGQGIALVPLAITECGRRMCIRRFSPPLNVNYVFAHAANQPLTPPMKKIIKYLRGTI